MTHATIIDLIGTAAFALAIGSLAFGMWFLPLGDERQPEDVT